MRSPENPPVPRRHGSLALAILAVALALPVCLSAQTPTPIQRATVFVKPAVVHIQTIFTAHVLWDDTIYGPIQTGGTGSGFLITPDGFVVTNAHVVEATPETVQNLKLTFAYQLFEQLGRQPTQEELANVVGGSLLVDPAEGQAIKSSEIDRRVSVLTKAGIATVKELQNEFLAEVRAESTFEQKDIAILKINGSNFPTVELGDSDRLNLQDTVTVIGYPGAVLALDQSGLFAGDSAMEVTITQGIVSSFKTWHDGSRIIGTDASAAPGNSGGPAIDVTGKVVGILSMRTTEETFQFLRPINVAKDFIRSVGVEPRSGLTDQRYHTALDAYWTARELMAAGQGAEARGAFQTARENLQSLLNLYPQHPDAQAYLVRVEEAMASLASGGGDAAGAGGLSANLPLVAGIVGLVLVLGAVAFLVARRRPTVSTAGARPVQASLGAPPAPAAPEPDVAPAPAPALPSPPPAGAKHALVAESGPLAGNRFEFGSEGLTIGRDPTRCQVVYQADTVSREHARIQPSPDGGLLVTNLSTTNKTYVNDSVVSQSVVRPGDRIRVSQVVFRLEG